LKKNKKYTKPKYTKVETIEEYLARGGIITVIPPQSSDPNDNSGKRIAKSTAKGMKPLTDLGEGEILYGEKIKKTRKIKKKAPELPQDQVDMLPDSLKHLANRKTDA